MVGVVEMDKTLKLAWLLWLYVTLKTKISVGKRSKTRLDVARFENRDRGELGIPVAMAC